ncbi:MULTISPECIES: Flp pilus assembly protein CpaB [Shimia]|uniref:Flp pilus assembly protein CpaB n=1 Tax=Shimia TaxID=573139 RepID=UPI001FB2F589|nr:MULTISPECIES: Flp pilus assembly protein CpaB [Shimia]MDV4145959.1 Flp pilus assembly protein CpaB [Shimia sp. FJ5]
MRVIFALVLLVGLGLAGFAVYMAQNYIEGYQSALAKEKAARKPDIETIEVYVMARAMEYGDTLTQEDVKMVKYPKKSLPEGIFTSEEALFPENDDRKRIILRKLEPMEPLLAAKITMPGEDAGIQSRLAKGMRAFAIKVDVASGVAGFLRPGDRVDVYWTGRVKGSGGEIGNDDITKLIQANIDLIAIDQTANQDFEASRVARTVTVAVKPHQVAALAQAQSTGSLSLALVGAQDDTVAEAIEVDQRSLLGIEQEAEVVEFNKPEPECTIRTRKGSEVVEIPIPCTN